MGLIDPSVYFDIELSECFEQSLNSDVFGSKVDYVEISKFSSTSLQHIFLDEKKQKINIYLPYLKCIQWFEEFEEEEIERKTHRNISCDGCTALAFVRI